MKNLLLTGAKGLLGSQVRSLLEPDTSISLFTPSSKELDLRNSERVRQYFDRNRVDSVIHCASLVGGIRYNIDHQYELAVQNALINMNILNECVSSGIERLITIGSSCCYPVDALQPFEENSYKPGRYESTNSNYALSKMIMSEAIESLSLQDNYQYKTIIMCNLFGHQTKSNTTHYHLINAISDKCKIALRCRSQNIVIGGSGLPRREFLDSLSAGRLVRDALYNYEELPSRINCGYYVDHSVIEYYDMICSFYGFKPQYIYDRGMPDGVFSKKMNINKALQLGWKPSNIEESIRNFIAQENV